MMVAAEIDSKQNMPLSHLDLQDKYLKALERNGLNTVGDVLEKVKKSRKALLKLEGIGPSFSDAILDAIEDAGFYIEAPPDEQQRTPDDDELGDLVIELVQPSHAYFRDTWHKYNNGYWQESKGINHEIIATLRANRWKGVRPSRARCSSVEFFVQVALEVEDDSQVDNYPQYINLRNGLFNLNTFQLENHRKDVLVTARCDFNYDKNAAAPNFRNWIASMLVKEDGTTDFELINLLQEAMGYSLTSDTSRRVSFWVWGPTGSGKSTLLNILVALMESYHAPLDLNQLGTNRFLLARIAGKRLVTFGEADAQTKLADGMYKMLVSDDIIIADVKNREPIEFVPQCKIWWGMNNLPYVSDRSGAIDSRVIILPMRQQIPREDWDLELDNKLKGELAGIFNFALEGLQRLRRQGDFTRVAQVEALRDDYRKSQDIYAAFLEDDAWVTLDDGKTEPTLLYKAFCAWANESGIKHHASGHSIAREWERLKLKRGNSGGRFYSGVSLTMKARQATNFV
jgi:P4 family phage/plasmid primase-like protien